GENSGIGCGQLELSNLKIRGIVLDVLDKRGQSSGGSNGAGVLACNLIGRTAHEGCANQLIANPLHLAARGTRGIEWIRPGFDDDIKIAGGSVRGCRPRAASGGPYSTRVHRTP